MINNIVLFANIALLVLFAILFIVCLLYLYSSIVSANNGAPFVPNNNQIIAESLKIAELDRDDVLFDLGSGDGRVLIKAVKSFSVKKAVGYEVSLFPYLVSMIIKKLSGKMISKKIIVHKRSFLEADLSDASVIYVYLLSELLKKLEPLFLKYKGSKKKVVSVAFKIDYLKPEKIIYRYHPMFKKEVPIYLYIL